MFVPVSGSRHVPGLAIESVRGGVAIDVWGQTPEGFFGAGEFSNMRLTLNWWLSEWVSFVQMKER